MFERTRYCGKTRSCNVRVHGIRARYVCVRVRFKINSFGRLVSLNNVRIRFVLFMMMSFSEDDRDGRETGSGAL